MRKKKLTLLPSTARLYAFVFFFLFLLYCMHGNNARAKTSSQRASSDDAFLQRARSSFFFYYVLKRMSIHISFSYIYFFCTRCLHSTAENKRKARPLSLLFLHIYIYIYIRNKSQREGLFFDENDKPDRKSLHQITHGVKKSKKKKRWTGFFIQ